MKLALTHNGIKTERMLRNEEIFPDAHSSLRFRAWIPELPPPNI
jgi:hypothetical protein